MKIVILRKNADDMLRQNQIRWTLFNQKNIVLFMLYALVGIVFLITAFARKDTDNFWGPGSVLGLSFIFLAIFYLSHTYQNRKKYIAQTNQRINRYNKQAMGVEITISDNGVTYKDFEAIFEVQWTYFTQYKFYKDYLFIISDSANLGSVIINKNEIAPEQFDELLGFVKNKLQERK